MCTRRPDPGGAASPPLGSSLGHPGRVTASKPGPGSDVWGRKGLSLHLLGRDCKTPLEAAEKERLEKQWGTAGKPPPSPTLSSFLIE